MRVESQDQTHVHIHVNSYRKWINHLREMRREQIANNFFFNIFPGCQLLIFLIQTHFSFRM